MTRKNQQPTDRKQILSSRAHTPTALIINTWRRSMMAEEKTSELIERMRPYVSEEEYVLSKLEIEKGGEQP